MAYFLQHEKAKTPIAENSRVCQGLEKS